MIHPKSAAAFAFVDFVDALYSSSMYQDFVAFQTDPENFEAASRNVFDWFIGLVGPD